MPSSTLGIQPLDTWTARWKPGWSEAPRRLPPAARGTATLARASRATDHVAQAFVDDVAGGARTRNPGLRRRGVEKDARVHWSDIANLIPLDRRFRDSL